MHANPVIPESDPLLDPIQRHAFEYFVHERDAGTGLVRDNTRPGAPASIAAVGLGLACYPVAVERGFIGRSTAAEHVRATLHFFHESEQSVRPAATGYRGFYYHFLEVPSGRRAGRCELSTIDSTLLVAGALLAARYFEADDAVEAEVRATADALYRRMDWTWALAGGAAVSHGWKPERGFLHARWRGYNEALLLYVLGLGSPTHPLPAASYAAWQETYRWRTVYGHAYLYAGPLFVHQLAHAWLDFRGIADAYMRARGSDYFENSRRATLVQQAYAARNPRGFADYGAHAWGITASDGPGPAMLEVDGRPRRFYGYRARGVPWGPDDGTLSPWAVAASLPFAPELVRRALAHVDACYPEMAGALGYRCSYNPTFPSASRGAHGWVSPGWIGIDQGPVVLMIENHRSGLPWRLTRGCPYVTRGLRRAGFTGGWLDAPAV